MEDRIYLQSLGCTVEGECRLLDEYDANWWGTLHLDLIIDFYSAEVKKYLHSNGLFSMAKPKNKEGVSKQCCDYRCQKKIKGIHKSVSYIK